MDNDIEATVDGLAHRGSTVTVPAETTGIEARIAQAWEELLNANAAVAAAVARREGAQRRYDALKREPL